MSAENRKRQTLARPRRRFFAAGGCCFAEDPDRHASEALPFWDPDRCPHVLRLVVHGAATQREMLAALAIGHCPVRQIWEDSRTVHLLYGDGDRLLQLRLRGGAADGLPRLAAELPTEARGRGPTLEVLARFFHLQAGGCIDGLDLPDARSLRLSLALRALDGSLAGKKQREIAMELLGAARVEQDWRHPGQHMRDQVRRAVKRGRAMMHGGYLRLLG